MNAPTVAQPTYNLEEIQICSELDSFIGTVGDQYELITHPVIRYRVAIHLVMIGSLDDRGFWDMIPGAGGLNPKAVAGGPSVTKFTHSKCMALKGSGKPQIAEINIAAISPMLQLIKKQMNDWS